MGLVNMNRVMRLLLIGDTQNKQANNNNKKSNNNSMRGTKIYCIFLFHLRNGSIHANHVKNIFFLVVV